MTRIKSFNEFINETFLEQQVDADILDHNKKKMKKNGYIEAKILQDVDGLKKGETVLVTATEFGQLEDEALITCYKDDKKIITTKNNLQL